MIRIVISLLIFLTAFCFADNDSIKQPTTPIAVLDLEMRGGLSPEENKSLSDRLRGELVATGHYTVLERGSMEAILKEQDFQQTGACSDTSCIVEIGRILAVRKIIGGSIGKVGGVFSINIKIIDVQTGVIESQFADDLSCSKAELVSFHIRNIARQMAGMSKLDKPWTMRWYAQWYVWTPLIVAGTAAGLYAIFSGDETDNSSQGSVKMRTIPIDGTVE